MTASRQSTLALPRPSEQYDYARQRLLVDTIESELSRLRNSVNLLLKVTPLMPGVPDGPLLQGIWNSESPVTAGGFAFTGAYPTITAVTMSTTDLGINNLTDSLATFGGCTVVMQSTMDNTSYVKATLGTAVPATGVVQFALTAVTHGGSDPALWGTTHIQIWR